MLVMPLAMLMFAEVTVCILFISFDFIIYSYLLLTFLRLPYFLILHNSILLLTYFLHIILNLQELFIDKITFIRTSSTRFYNTSLTWIMAKMLWTCLWDRQLVEELPFLLFLLDLLVDMFYSLFCLCYAIVVLGCFIIFHC